MKPTKKQITKELGRLRGIINSCNDPILTRIAYAVETNLIWATENTTDWEPPLEEVMGEAAILKRELEAKDREIEVLRR